MVPGVAAAGGRPGRHGRHRAAGGGMRRRLIEHGRPHRVRGSSSTDGGSAGSGGSSNAGGSKQAQQDLAFAQCIRSDGVTDFPDPGSNGQFGTIPAQMEDSPRFGTGFNVCKHLLPDGGVGKAQQDSPQLLKFAQCMHAHGVPTYPESGPVSPYSVIGPNTAVNSLKVAGVNPNSPVVQAAARTCERLNPVGSLSAGRFRVAGRPGRGRPGSGWRAWCPRRQRGLRAAVAGG